MKKHVGKLSAAQQDFFAKMVPDNGDILSALQSQQKLANSFSAKLNLNVFGPVTGSEAEQKQKEEDKSFEATKIAQGNFSREPAWVGDIVTDIFVTEDYDQDTTAVEYPISPLLGKEDQFTAIVMPDEGAVPERIITGNSAFVRPFDLANSVTWKQSYARQGNIAAISSRLNCYSAGFVQKINDVGWNTLCGAAVGRGYVVQGATDGIFDRASLTSMARYMRRYGGGNIASTLKFNLTDLFVSPECFEDILLWDAVDVGANVVERYMSMGFGDGIVIHGVRVRVMDELGVGQRYENYIVNTLGVTHTGSKTEFMIGLDMNHRDAFKMPVARQITMTPDDSQWKRQLMGYYGFCTLGAAVLDTRAVLLGEI